jgi:cysteate synthase
MYNAWKARRRFIVPSIDMPNAKENITEIHADVLSNRNPAYSMIGGVYDALQDTSGEMYAVTNDEVIAAASLFENLEGIDIVPAAAVATASLLQAVEHQKIGASEIVLLNITGGGEKRLLEDRQHHTIEPKLIVDNPRVPLEEILKAIT